MNKHLMENIIQMHHFAMKKFLLIHDLLDTSLKLIYFNHLYFFLYNINLLEFNDSNSLFFSSEFYSLFSDLEFNCIICKNYLKIEDFSVSISFKRLSIDLKLKTINSLKSNL